LLDRLQGKKVDDTTNLARLTDNCSLISETLPHEVTLLSMKNKEKHLLKFWAKVVSGVDLPPITANHRIDNWLSNCRVDFDYASGLITQTTEEKTRYCKIISLNQWGETSSGEILQQIISLPYEILCLQLLSGKDKEKSKKFIKDELKYRKANKQQEELAVAGTLVDNEEALFFEHQLSIFVFALSLPELIEAISKIREVFRSYELIPIVETTAIKQVYLQLFPGNETKLRTTHLLSSNVAHMLNFHTDSPGLLKSSWANFPIANFKTASGTYGFSFHREAEGKEIAANTLVIAPTGSGKTVLLTYLVAMSLRVPNLHAFIFDRNYGCKIAGHAFEGEHIDLTGTNAAINIFCCDDTPANKLFVTDFLLQLAGFSQEHAEAVPYKNLLRQAVNIMFSLPKEERIFSDFYDELIPRAHPLYQRLQVWGKGEYSRWISGYQLVDGKRQACDALQFGASKLVVIEMTTILDSPELVILVEYIMHRIRTQISGKGVPHLIVVDETAQMVKNSIVKKRLGALLQEIRKSNGSVVVCFQNPTSIFGKNQNDSDKELADIILNNCHTQILFPNPKADSVSYAPFKLCDREWQFVLGQHRAKQRLRRPVLIRKDREKEGMQSAIIDVDLSHLGKYFNLIRSGGEFVEIFNSVYNKGDPAWVEKYLARV